MKFLGLFTFIFLGSVTPVYACSCTLATYLPLHPTLHDWARFKKIGVYAEAVSEIKGKNNEPTKIQFRAIEQIKGDIPDTFVANNGPGPNGCGAVFYPGAKYILSLDSEKNDWIEGCWSASEVPNFSSDEIHALKSEIRSAWTQEYEERRKKAYPARERYLAGESEFRRGDLDRAEKDWQEALRLNPDNADAKIGLQKISDARSKSKK